MKSNMRNTFSVQFQVLKANYTHLNTTTIHHQCNTNFAIYPVYITQLSELSLILSAQLLH